MVTKEKSPTGLRASYIGVLTDKDGKVKQVVEKKNLVVDAGLDELLNLAGGLSANHFGFIAMGLSAPTVTYASVALGNEPGSGTFRKSTSNTISQNANNTTPAILRLQTTFNAGEATGGLTESGIFNVSVKAAAGEAMLAADTFAVINKGASDVLTWTWEITLQRV